MARMFPPRWVNDDDGRWAEHQVYKALRTLDDDWTVIHEVFWNGERDSRIGDIEIDFFLFHPTNPALVLEVKGGSAIRCVNKVWEGRNRNGWQEIKDPFKQAIDNQYLLRQRLKRLGGPVPFIVHGVVFPSASIGDQSIGLHSRELIWDREDLADTTAALACTLDYHNAKTHRLSPSERSRLTNLLASTFSVGSLLSRDIELAVAQQIELTEEQRNVLRAVASFRRLGVIGPAGSGKTLLAVERARQLATEDRDVLLVCFNHLLGQVLRPEFADEPRVTVDSFHRFALRTCERAGTTPPGERNSKFFDTALPEAFFDAAEWIDLRFDAIIIDEAQDFQALWITILESLLRNEDSSYLTIFSDSEQNIFGKESNVAMISEPVELSINCRNTRAIADRATAPVGLDVATRVADINLDPVAIHTIDDSTIERALTKEINRLLKTEGLAPSQVTILSPSAPFVERWRGRSLGGIEIGPHGAGALTMETIHRFKGLEAQAVVVVVPQQGPWNERLAYVAFSRARAYLSMIADASHFEVAAWETE